jgi:hypothetical protein
MLALSAMIGLPTLSTPSVNTSAELANGAWSKVSAF